MTRVEVIVCVDFGSTFTKTALVAVPEGELVATASHRTTIDSDLMDGLQVCLKRLAEVDSRATEAQIMACSSAGGGLRIAVVGNEELVTAEAGRRVALSSGGRVVQVMAGRVDGDLLAQSSPDVVLLVGGTDGGDSDVLLSCATSLAEGQFAPVVFAGNREARQSVSHLFKGKRVPHAMTDNVLPTIGVLEPAAARAAIRDMFVTHVIGGKRLSTKVDLARFVQGATPDVVLTAVEHLAELAGDVVVVDVGGATTDVHSVVTLDPDSIGREVVAQTRASRTVEGDLGMRWSAVATVEEGLGMGLLSAADRHTLMSAASHREEDPRFVPARRGDVEMDQLIATTAMGAALRRHAGRARVVLSPEGRVVERSGKDLRQVDLVVGSGGVLRHAGSVGKTMVAQAFEPRESWQLPAATHVAIDKDYVLAPAGLLAPHHPRAARNLLQTILANAGASSERNG